MFGEGLQQVDGMILERAVDSFLESKDANKIKFLKRENPLHRDALRYIIENILIDPDYDPLKDSSVINYIKTAIDENQIKLLNIYQSFYIFIRRNEYRKDPKYSSFREISHRD